MCALVFLKINTPLRCLIDPCLRKHEYLLCGGKAFTPPVFFSPLCVFFSPLLITPLAQFAWSQNQEHIVQ